MSEMYRCSGTNYHVKDCDGCCGEFEYLEVDPLLMANACSSTFGFTVYSNWVKTTDYIEVPRALLEELVAFMKTTYEPCDHSVGICSCSMGESIGELELRLKGLMTCPTCGGEGLERLGMDHHTFGCLVANEQGYHCGDWHWRKCSRCDSKLVVPYERQGTNA